MPSNIKSTHKENNKSISPRAIAIIAGFILIVWFILDIVGIGGNIRFYAKWAECGQKPVISGATYEGLAPNHLEAPQFALIRLSPKQFCTPLEAELRGYSASPNQYDFPEIKKAYRSLCRKETDPESETVRKFDLCKDGQ